MQRQALVETTIVKFQQSIQVGFLHSNAIDLLIANQALLRAIPFRDAFKNKIMPQLNNESLYLIAVAIVNLNRGVPMREDEQLFGDLYVELLKRYAYDPRVTAVVPNEINLLNWYLLQIFRKELHHMTSDAQEQAFANVVMMKVNAVYLNATMPSQYKKEWLTNIASAAVRECILNDVVKSVEFPSMIFTDEVDIAKQFHDTATIVAFKSLTFFGMNKPVGCCVELRAGKQDASPEKELASVKRSP
jgi:hypothetical protein